MSEKEELIFGLKRWMSKAVLYVGSYTNEEFFDDELVFDAVSYCIEVIYDIANRLVGKYSDIKEEYKNVDFNLLTNIKSKIYVNDNVNISLIYELCTKTFKEILTNF